MSAIHRRRFECVKLAILTIVLAAFMTGDALLLQELIASVEASDWSRFAIMSVVILAYIPVQAGFYFWRQSFAEHVANLLLNDMRADMFHRVCRIPMAQYTRTGSDKYLSNLTVQLDGVKANLIDVAIWGGYLVCQLVFAVITILAINPVLGLCALVLCIPPALVPILMKRPVERARHRLVDATDEMNQTTGDLLRGMADWRLAGRSREIMALFGGRSDDWRRAANKDASVQKGVDTMSDTLSHVLVFGVWIAGGFIIMRGGMTVAQIIAFTSLTGNISVPLFYASGLISQWHAGRETLASIEQLIPQSNDVDAKAVVPPKRVDDHRMIELNNFHPHAGEREADGISFVFDCNKRYMIVGRSGSGKSSLVRPIAGLDDDWSGAIVINGHRYTSRDIARMRTADIGYLAQSSHLFRASIRDNVRLFDERVSDEEIMSACDRAHIGDWVRDRGLDTIIDDDLQQLSGGEKQRILLARLLVRHCEFCVLDELTTGLDGHNASLVEQTMLGMFHGFVLISHHLDEPMLRAMDATIVMDHGHIAAVGSYDQVAPVMRRFGLL